MKTKIILSVILAFFLTSTEAQILKKIGKRVQDAAENTVLNKAERETSKKTDQILDQVLNPTFSSGELVDPKKLPKNYAFEWTYKLNMKARKQEMNITYFLKKDAQYFASNVAVSGMQNLRDMVMIQDPTIPAIIILTKQEGVNMGSAINYNLNDLEDEDSNNSMEGYEFKKIGSKQILGYTCQGYQLENKKHIMKMYFLPNAPISFNNMFSSNKMFNCPKDSIKNCLKSREMV